MVIVITTTPELFVADDYLELSHVPWEVLVVDEAHQIMHKVKKRDWMKLCKSFVQQRQLESGHCENTTSKISCLRWCISIIEHRIELSRSSCMQIIQVK